MAVVLEISPTNFDAFDPLIPDILKRQSVLEGGFRFYGIIDSGEAVGCIVFLEKADEIQLRYIYLLPHLRGLGVIDDALMTLFLTLKDDGYNYVTAHYIPEEYQGFKAISQRFGFSENPSEYAYFRFRASAIKNNRVATFEPKGIMRFQYLPEDKRQALYKIIDKSFEIYGTALPERESILPYSMVYMEKDQPKGALLLETPSASRIPTSDSMGRFSESEAYDLLLFFVGTTKLTAPLYLLSGLCRILQDELDENSLITGYFPESHVTKLLEGALGVKGQHEVAAILNLALL